MNLQSALELNYLKLCLFSIIRLILS